MTNGHVRVGLDPDHPSAIHVVGIGGAGMSAIAVALRSMGHMVTGSDLKESPVTSRLAGLGIPVAIGHAAENVGAAKLVTVSTAVTRDNPERAEAERRGVPVLARAEMLAAVTDLRRCIAVAGTHGKTTTASMLALILVEAGLHPSFLIGGDVNEIGTNAVWEEGEWVVVEADESDGTFLVLSPELAVVTNVEPDHLDHYGSFTAVESAFERFVEGTSEGVVMGGDDPVSAAIAARTGADTVGVGPACTWRLVDVEPGRSHISFGLEGPAGRHPGALRVPVPGLHNARNAAVAVVTAMRAGVAFEVASRAIARFAGVARRFEFRGEAAGVTFVDDYAHLPSEVAAVLAAARDGGWPRVVAVFQPHRYSRTQAIGGEFGPAFAGADVVVVTDVYPAGEAPVPGVSGRLVADAVRDARPEIPVVYVPGRAELRGVVTGVLQGGDLCCTMGAGDLTSLPDELMAHPEW